MITEKFEAFQTKGDLKAFLCGIDSAAKGYDRDAVLAEVAASKIAEAAGVVLAAKGGVKAVLAETLTLGANTVINIDNSNKQPDKKAAGNIMDIIKKTRAPSR
ncbi:MAG: hypothetical protein AB7U85_06285 [Alphaproteobacteria bacterium]